MKRFKIDGASYAVEMIGYSDSKAEIYLYRNGHFLSRHELTMYYRQERTWDDHMGNTPCGYYVNVPIRGSKRRVYLF